MYRRVTGQKGSSLEVALGEQRDRLTGERGVRLPKGHLDPGETPEQAALREVAEETGLEARLVAPLGSVSYRYREGAGEVDKHVHFFLMEWVGGEPAGDGELDRVFWCPLESAERELRFATERAVLARARERLSGP